MMADLYPNPEVAWHAERELASVDYVEITKRIPGFTGHVATLSGGLANDSFRLGEDRVLRIYRRDPFALVRERKLLSRQWGKFRVPQVFQHGTDFLLLEYVEHTPLENTAEQGHAAGLALGEIHHTKFDTCGLFGDAIQVKEPWDDFVSEILEYINSHSDSVGADKTLLSAVEEFISDRTPTMQECCQRAVLLHGDFKASNLHWTSDGRLLVLDWEFTYAGPAYMDIGQLVRFGCPDPFRSNFVDAYTSSDGSLTHDWEERSRIFDLVNLVGLLSKAPANSQQAEDCRHRIEENLQA